jgi:glycosyltransferase involved in cell wall biosynthesis
MKKISFCINTAKNELNHIKLLFSSLQHNLKNKKHEIIVFIDSDNQGTSDWLIEQKEIFPNLKILQNTLPICYGYARNINEMFKFASNEIVSYLQSDMVICKNYDVEILKNLEDNMILCSTRIEPPLHGNSGEKHTYDFGTDPTKFDLKKFNEYAESIKEDKITEYFFAPFTLYKDVWLSIGGHNTLYRRSREDSDILIRLVLNNVKIKQTWNALVYHFTCTSSRGPEWFNKENTQAQERVQLQQQADYIEMHRIIRKWGKFQHNTNKLKSYNISAIIHNISTEQSLHTLFNIESAFHKIYIEQENIITLAQTVYDNMHVPANKLLSISDKNWKEYGYMYNQTAAKDRIFLLNEDVQKDDVIIEFDIQKCTTDHIMNFISKIQYIIDESTETGLFEHDIFKIQINKLVDRSTEKIQISNPIVKQEHQYQIL